MIDTSIQNNLHTYYNKIHTIDIYSILKKRNIEIPQTIRETLYTCINSLDEHKHNFHTIIHNIHNKYIDDELKLLLCIFKNVLFYEINTLDIIFIFYYMDVHTLKNFIRFYNIQIIKCNKNVILEKPLGCITYDASMCKYTILKEINTYSNTDIIHTLLIINFVKKYYFSNLFIV